MRDYNFTMILVGMLSIMVLGVAGMSYDVLMKLSDLYVFTGIILGLCVVTLVSYLKSQ